MNNFFLYRIKKDIEDLRELKLVDSYKIIYEEKTFYDNSQNANLNEIFLELDRRYKDKLKLYFMFKLSFDNEYYSNTYSFEVVFTDEYPFESPKVYCNTRTFHPNIYAMSSHTNSYKGSVCLNILRLGWMPSFNINSIVVSLIDAFESISTIEPFDLEAAKLFNEDPVEFKHKIKMTENIFMSEDPNDNSADGTS